MPSRGRDEPIRMKLPNSQDAWIPKAKLDAYLLDPDHPTGGAKARFFSRLGFSRASLGGLEQSLLELAQREVVRQELTTRHGTKYVLDGYIEGVQGKRRKVRTVWIVETGAPRPAVGDRVSFVTVDAVHRRN